MTRFLFAARDNKVRQPEHMGAFLNGICNNVILEYHRKVWREGPYEPDSYDPPQRPEAELLEVRDAVQHVLNQLSERDRLILRAFYLEEKNKEDICEATGISMDQFRVALFRAKARFRKILQEMKQKAVGSHSN
jgi:RNA polymerase sigma-70 factor (ECF subfamily)